MSGLWRRDPDEPRTQCFHSGHEELWQGQCLLTEVSQITREFSELKFSL